MKYLSGLLFFIFIFFACQEVEKKKSKLTESVFEEKEDSLLPNFQEDTIIPIDSIQLKIDTINIILPTPDAKFFSSLDTSKIINAEYVIDKYLETYFYIIEPEKVIRRTQFDHPEGEKDCGFRTIYNNDIIIEDDFGCESYVQTTTIEFKNYSYEEVERVIEILLPKKYNRNNDNGEPGDLDGWEPAEFDQIRYYNYNDHCSLSITTGEGKRYLSYGCGC